MPRKSLNESVADENAAPGGVAAVDRALSVLSAFQDGDAALSLAELAERTRLYKSTVLRLLASLEHGAGFSGWMMAAMPSVRQRHACMPCMRRAFHSISWSCLSCEPWSKRLARVRPTMCARVESGCACTVWIRPIPCATTLARAICCRWARGRRARSGGLRP